MEIVDTSYVYVLPTWTEVGTRETGPVVGITGFKVLCHPCAVEELGQPDADDAVEIATKRNSHATHPIVCNSCRRTAGYSFEPITEATP